MAPLILHNVPEDERYIGEDGVRRPYAVLFPGSEGHAGTARARKSAPESGSFGKPTRRGSQRSSKTATPAKREDPTILASDALFSGFFASQPSQTADPQTRKPGMGSMSQSNLANSTNAPADSNGSQSRYQEPTEVVLRGFLSSHQYAAIDTYERIAGRICEDYPRDPPHEQQRYQFNLRDHASMRRRPLTAEERAKAFKFAGGEHWIKITFESAQAAEAATTNSPQKILGHMVYAELYRGVPPASDEAIPATGNKNQSGLTRHHRHSSQGTGAGSSFFGANGASRTSSTLPRSFTTPEMAQVGRDNHSMSPPGSNDSSHTLDSATLSTATMSSATASSTTVVGQPAESMQVVEDSVYCRKIPAAKRAQLLPAEQALLPQQSYSQRFLSNFGLAGWFKIELIGSQTPRLDNGEFDWAKASLYWRLMWWLDSVFNLMGGEIAGSLDKED